MKNNYSIKIFIPILKERAIKVKIVKSKVKLTKVLVKLASKRSKFQFVLKSHQKLGLFLSEFTKLKNLPPGFWKISVNGTAIKKAVNLVSVNSSDKILLEYTLTKA